MFFRILESVYVYIYITYTTPTHHFLATYFEYFLRTFEKVNLD